MPTLSDLPDEALGWLSVKPVQHGFCAVNGMQEVSLLLGRDACNRLMGSQAREQQGVVQQGQAIPQHLGSDTYVTYGESEYTCMIENRHVLQSPRLIALS